MVQKEIQLYMVCYNKIQILMLVRRRKLKKYKIICISLQV